MQLRKKENSIRAKATVVISFINNVNILTLLILLMFHLCFKIYKGNLYNICTIS